MLQAFCERQRVHFEILHSPFLPNWTDSWKWSLKRKEGLHYWHFQNHFHWFSSHVTLSTNQLNCFITCLNHIDCKLKAYFKRNYEPDTFRVFFKKKKQKPDECMILKLLSAIYLLSNIFITLKNNWNNFFMFNEYSFL